MIFDYGEYKSASFQFPLGIVIFCTTLIIFMIVLFFIVGYKKDQRSLLQVIIAFAIPIFLIIPSLFYLQYGIHLATETEDDYLGYTGEITEIKDPAKSPRYYYEGKAVRASIIIVDDLKLYFMTSGDLEVGDVITVRYLPESTFVLEVELIE